MHRICQYVSRKDIPDYTTYQMVYLQARVGWVDLTGTSTDAKIAVNEECGTSGRDRNVFFNCKKLFQELLF